MAHVPCPVTWVTSYHSLRKKGGDNQWRKKPFNSLTFCVFMHFNNTLISAINCVFIRGEKKDPRLGNVSGLTQGLMLAFPVLHIWMLVWKRRPQRSLGTVGEPRPAGSIQTVHFKARQQQQHLTRMTVWNTVQTMASLTSAPASRGFWGTASWW